MRGREELFAAHLLYAKILKNFSLAESWNHPMVLAEEPDLEAVR